MTLTFNTHISSFNQIASSHRLQWFQNNQLSSLFLQQGHHLNILLWAGVPGATCIQSFVEIGPAVLEKVLLTFKDFYHIYRHGGHLDHVTSIISTNFNFHVSKSFHTKFG